MIESICLSWNLGTWVLFLFKSLSSLIYCIILIVCLWWQKIFIWHCSKVDSFVVKIVIGVNLIFLVHASHPSHPFSFPSMIKQRGNVRSLWSLFWSYLCSWKTCLYTKELRNNVFLMRRSTVLYIDWQTSMPEGRAEFHPFQAVFCH